MVRSRSAPAPPPVGEPLPKHQPTRTLSAPTQQPKPHEPSPLRSDLPAPPSPGLARALQISIDKARERTPKHRMSNDETLYADMHDKCAE